jgi:hypothetical protein
LMDRWRETTETLGIHFKSHNNIPGRIVDWQDRWFRSPVHWAVLNERTTALQILLDGFWCVVSGNECPGRNAARNVFEIVW